MHNLPYGSIPMNAFADTAVRRSFGGTGCACDRGSRPHLRRSAHHPPVLVCNCDAFTTLEKAGYQAVTNSDVVITLGKSKSIQNRSRHSTGSVFCLEKTPSLPATLQLAHIWKLCLNFYKNFQFNRAK